MNLRNAGWNSVLKNIGKDTLHEAKKQIVIEQICEALEFQSKHLHAFLLQSMKCGQQVHGKIAQLLYFWEISLNSFLSGIKLGHSEPSKYDMIFEIINILTQAVTQEIFLLLEEAKKQIQTSSLHQNTIYVSAFSQGLFSQNTSGQSIKKDGSLKPGMNQAV